VAKKIEALTVAAAQGTRQLPLQIAFCLCCFSHSSHKKGIAYALSLLGCAASGEHEYEMAESMFERNVVLLRELGDLVELSDLLISLANLAYHQADHPGAARLICESLLLSRRVDYRWGVATSLEGLAAIAVGEEELERGACLFGKAFALREEISGRPNPTEPCEFQGGITTLHQHLGDAAFARAWAEGRAIGIGQIIVYALATAKAVAVAALEYVTHDATHQFGSGTEDKMRG
jgi:hypothetical protein